jgi:hypothetical protein
MFCRSLFVFLSIFSWPLCCLSFCLLATVLFVLLSLGHCVVFPSSIYVFLLPLWYLQTLRQFNRIIVSRREIPVISEIRPTFVTAGYNISKRGARWLYLDRLNILLRRLMSSSWISARACNLQQLLIRNNMLGVVAHCKATFPALFIILLVSCVQSTENVDI